MELSNETKLAIMKNKLQNLQQQKFSLEMDAEIYQAINPEKDVPEATIKNMKNVLIAIKVLNGKIKEME